MMPAPCGNHCPIAWLAVAALLALPQAAVAKVRALFVGIDTYEYSNVHDQFADLKGSVNDALGIRDALARTYAWNIDTGPPPTCPATSPLPAPPGKVPVPRLPATTISITLIQSCATHDAILGALQGLIALSGPGDTVLFYYAGHGAAIQDTALNNKASGLYDTILAYDSRGPADPNYRMEIPDRELNVIIENAMHVQGANVITIVDACHSGTDDRDPALRGRGAPTVKVNGMPALAEKLLPTNPALSQIGHRAHLAAAADDQIAMERAFGTAPVIDHGLFTRALIDTIPRMPGAALADILQAVQQQMADAAQKPTGDGLLMTLDGTLTPGVLIAATVAGDVVSLQEGRLGNVTAGSEFALYPDWSSARIATRTPLASGHVQQVDDNSATLVLHAPPAAPLPATAVARETSHAFGSTKVAVAVQLPDVDAAKTAAVAIASIAFAQLSASPEVIVTTDPQRPGRALAKTPDNVAIAALPPPADPDFADTLAKVIAPRARIDQMVTLANAQGVRELKLCVSTAYIDTSAGYDCPDPKPGGDTLVTDKPAYLVVANLAPEARFVYVFALADDNSVTLLTLQDAPLPGQRPLTMELVPNYAGKIRFLVLATAQAINGAALEQDGGARDPASCSTMLERLLCDANNGSRGGETVRIDDWAGLIRTVMVSDNAAARPGTGG